MAGRAMRMRGAAMIRAGAQVIAVTAGLLGSIYTARSDEPKQPVIEKSPRPRLRLSREVTYFTEPLAKDGLVDYAAAMNARYKDVTKENNAAAALVEMLGRGDEEAAEFASLCQRLGIAEVAQGSAPFRELDKFVEGVQLAFFADEEVTATRLKTTADVLRKQLDRDDWHDAKLRCGQRGWVAAEEPVISAWLDASAKSLTQFEAASRRSRYYLPLKSGDPYSGMLGSSSLSIRAMRLVDALRARAMRSLHAGDVDAAWKDVMAIRRWATLVCDPKPLIDQLIGIIFAQHASSAACVVVSHGKLSSAEIKKLHTEWKSVAAVPNMHEALSVGERSFGLDVLNTMHRAALHPALLRSLEGLSEEVLDEINDSPWRRRAIDVVLDWNAAYETMNLFYDELEVIGKLPPGKKRKATALAFEDKIERIAAGQANPYQWFTIATLDHTARRRAVARYFVAGRFISATMPAIVGVFDSEDRLRTHLEMTDVTFALARYRAAKGTYPLRLAELVPVLLEKPPADLLGDGQLQYKRLSECEFELYSVGANGKDDGGKTDSPLVDTTVEGDDEDGDDFDDADDLVIRVGPPR
jgi:hypothetical protein